MLPAFVRPLPRILAALSLLLIVGLTACDSNEPNPEGAGEEELITRVVLTLTPGGGGAAITLTAESNDGVGNGGLTLTPATLTLAANQTYSGTIGLFDDVNNENVTAEVDDEREEHQFFYTVAGASVTIVANDVDSNGLPVGLEYSVTTGGAGSGTLRVQLGHYGDAPKDGITLSDETDLDFLIPLAVQ